MTVLLLKITKYVKLYRIATAFTGEVAPIEQAIEHSLGFRGNCEAKPNASSSEHVREESVEFYIM